MNEPAPTYTTGFWVGLAVATPILGYGVTGALAQLPGVQLTSFVRYFVGAAVINDVVVAPAVCVLAWLVLRWVPRVAVVPVQAALVVSGVVGLVAIVWGLAVAVVAAKLLNARRR